MKPRLLNGERCWFTCLRGVEGGVVGFNDDFTLRDGSSIIVGNVICHLAQTFPVIDFFVGDFDAISFFDCVPSLFGDVVEAIEHITYDKCHNSQANTEMDVSSFIAGVSPDKKQIQRDEKEDGSRNHRDRRESFRESGRR